MAVGKFSGLDRYTLQARLLPVVIVFLPIGLAITSVFPINEIGWGILTSSLSGLTFVAFLAQIGRDLGKKMEPYLYEKWGGKPTSIIMRYKQTWLNPESLSRYHKKLSEILKVAQPSKEQEDNDPNEADKKYGTFVDYLKEKTRDHTAFPLVIEENINYGFRRNLWGMKSVGIILSLLAVIVPYFSFFLSQFIKLSMTKFNFIASAISACFLVFWVFRITPTWVKIAANAYAERLVTSCENIDAEN